MTLDEYFERASAGRQAALNLVDLAERIVDEALRTGWANDTTAVPMLHICAECRRLLGALSAQHTVETIDELRASWGPIADSYRALANALEGGRVAAAFHDAISCGFPWLLDHLLMALGISNPQPEDRAALYDVMTRPVKGKPWMLTPTWLRRFLKEGVERGTWALRAAVRGRLKDMAREDRGRLPRATAETLRRAEELLATEPYYGWDDAALTAWLASLSLTEAEKAAAVARLVEQISLAEHARDTGKSPETARVLWSRALKKIRLAYRELAEA